MYNARAQVLSTSRSARACLLEFAHLVFLECVSCQLCSTCVFADVFVCAQFFFYESLTINCLGIRNYMYNKLPSCIKRQLDRLERLILIADISPRLQSISQLQLQVPSQFPSSALII